MKEITKQERAGFWKQSPGFGKPYWNFFVEGTDGTAVESIIEAQFPYLRPSNGRETGTGTEFCLQFATIETARLLSRYLPGRLVIGVCACWYGTFDTEFAIDGREAMPGTDFGLSKIHADANTSPLPDEPVTLDCSFAVFDKTGSRVIWEISYGDMPESDYLRLSSMSGTDTGIIPVSAEEVSAAATVTDRLLRVWEEKGLKGKVPFETFLDHVKTGKPLAAKGRSFSIRKLGCRP